MDKKYSAALYVLCPYCPFLVPFVSCYGIDKQHYKNQKDRKDKKDTHSKAKFKMTAHSYILERYQGMQTRHTCPACGKSRSFVRYVNAANGDMLALHVGRCNRESKCGYHYTPKQYFQKHPDKEPVFQKIPATSYSQTLLEKPVYSTVPAELLRQSLTGYSENAFALYLSAILGAEGASKAIARYFIGSSNHWRGATVFWQLDILGKIRTGKIMLYNPITGKRVKEPFSHIAWVHKNLIKPEFQLRQCLFGEHLLRLEPAKPVAIVESEKTAVIASAYLPEFIWLATGSLNNLSASKCEVLRGRKLVLFPDLNGFDKWSAKAKELSGIAQITVSNLLEREASAEEKEQGYDLADYLVKYRPKRTSGTPDQVHSTAPLYVQAGRLSDNVFIGTNGKLYIKNPVCPSKYAVYSTIEAYNNRTELPEYVPASEALRHLKAYLPFDKLQLKVLSNN